MINRWEPGRADINAQLTAGYLQKVKPDRRLAELYIEHAKLHLAASRQTLGIDATGSFQLAYDASRKALAAVLENQGLRATSKGGHRAVEDALRAPTGAAEVSLFSGAISWVLSSSGSSLMVRGLCPGAGFVASRLRLIPAVRVFHQALFLTTPR